MATNYDGLPLDVNVPETRIIVDSAIEWVKSNTTMELDPGEELPANVKLFALKFYEVMSAQAGVTSESLGGMSQSFDAAGSAAILRQYAAQLLAPYYASGKFIPMPGRWA